MTKVESKGRDARGLYAVLGVSPLASTGEIVRSARRKLAELHPDRGGDPSEFAKVAAAYRELRNPERRHDYDLERPSLQGSPLGVSVPIPKVKEAEGDSDEGPAWWKEPMAVLGEEDVRKVSRWLDMVMGAAHRFHYETDVKVGVYVNGGDYEYDGEFALVKKGVEPDMAMAQLYVLRRKVEMPC